MPNTIIGPHGKPIKEIKVKPFSEVGTSGLKRSGGYVREEFIRTLRGRRGQKVYDEMEYNDEIISGILFAVENLLSQTKFRTEPGEKTPQGQEDAEFLESNMHDMSTSWNDTIKEASSFVARGFSYHELIYKIRKGPYHKDGKFRSKFSDGKIGWRKIPGRAQESIVDNWIFGPNGEILGAAQRAEPDFQTRNIPIEKSLLFRTTIKKNNPEGLAVIRGAYRSWYFKKNIQNYEAIGVERDLAGLPVGRVPSSVLEGQGSNAALKTEYETMITNIRRDEQEGILLSSERDDKGHYIYDINLLSSGGARTFNTNEIIRRYDQGIALSMLANFIMLGTGKVGSLAMIREHINIFSLAINGFLDTMLSIFNRFAVPRLFALNGFTREYLPTIAHGGVQKVDLDQLGKYIQTLTSSGMTLFPNEPLEEHLLKVANLPVEESQG